MQSCLQTLSLENCYWQNITKIILQSLSIITLIPAILIFSFVPTLHCARNFIHTNLMISFFLRRVFKINSRLLNVLQSAGLKVIYFCKPWSEEYFLACNNILVSLKSFSYSIFGIHLYNIYFRIRSYHDLPGK